jgi:hypothetical protein
MSDVLISYAREDLHTARRMANALEMQGWSVFWDRTIPAGKTWRDVIGAALDQCGCVVVLWSKHSISSRWVIEEAEHGLKKGLLAPALIENVEPPLGFGSIQAADLSVWSGSQEDPALQSFLADIAEILGSLPATKSKERPEAEKHTRHESKAERSLETETGDDRRVEEESIQAEASTNRGAAALDSRISAAPPQTKHRLPLLLILGGLLVGWIVYSPFIHTDWTSTNFFTIPIGTLILLAIVPTQPRYGVSAVIGLHALNAIMIPVVNIILDAQQGFGLRGIFYILAIVFVNAAIAAIISRWRIKKE